MSDAIERLSVTRLKGVGPRVAEKLLKLGIHTLQDVLFHFPLRYEDRTRVVPIGSLRAGDQVMIEATVDLTEVKFQGRRALLSRISDGTGSLTIRLFHFGAAQQALLARGTQIRCFGEVRRGRQTLEMIHPEFARIDPEAASEVDNTLTPIYPTTEGVHQLTLRKLSEQALEFLPKVREWLPEELLQQQDMMCLQDAILHLHRPAVDVSQLSLQDGKHPAQARLAFEELIAHHISLRQIRERQRTDDAYSVAANSSLVAAFLKQLPFTLTSAQLRVNDEILDDMQQSAPMHRLVQGDVGSGKTVVAACAALAAIDAGLQVALMAPTELLAEQHLQNFSNWLSPLGIQPMWLAGSVKGKSRKDLLQKLASGDEKIIIGTHALFQDDVSFARLGLVIIDEQHRFGVHQRMALRDKGADDGKLPHQLIMTATPIPRTLAMTFYADLDSSIIDELPPGRTPVTTVVIPDNRRVEVVQRVHDACLEKRQVYWVCTLIEESDVLQCEAAEDTAQQLAEALTDIRVGLVHGRMKPADKERIMAQFKAGELDLLVATTVIEVGVDVPNATLMVIENAERLGLSQLHQLRGRVGRGAQSSNCVLLYRSPLSRLARERLAVMRETNDGFKIAQYDLEQRGPGEVMGTRQTGMAQLRVADLVRDQHMVSAVEQAANAIMQSYPECTEPLIQRWLGEAQQYGSV